MDSIRIQGRVALQGKVHIQGSKNAALPILAATLLVGEDSVIENCPKIVDVQAMVSLLKSMGCRVYWQENGLAVDSSKAERGEMPKEAVTGMRSSLCLLGAMIGRYGEAVMERPGGCVIGDRPIDIHLNALKKMGVEFTESEGKLRAAAKNLRGAEISMPFPSVGATENVILAGVMAEGETILHGAALEPEITALCDYLRRCGADIEGVGTDRLLIRGGKKLYGTSFQVPSDRIVAGTYLFGCIGAGGSVLLEDAPAGDLAAALKVAEEMGAKVCATQEGIYVQAPARVQPVKVSTAPYPGFPTDLQSAALAASVCCEGKSVIEETIFENRFRIVEELEKMGAHIEVRESRRAEIFGVERLCGSRVEARELRGGAALVIAGLMAEGETYVSGCAYIYRGYENICRDFRELGARVISV